jgi:hypothetical protein
MNTSLNHGPAKIYQFPAGGRSALGGGRSEETKPVTDPDFSYVYEAGCWYHEAAINAAMQEPKPGRER